MDWFWLLGKLYWLAQALLDSLQNCTASLIFFVEIRSVQVKMGDDSHTVLYMIKDQHRFAETDDCYWQAKRVLFWHRHALKTCHSLVGEISGSPTVKPGKFIGCLARRLHQAILTQFCFNEFEGIMAGNFFDPDMGVRFAISVAHFVECRGLALMDHHHVRVDTND